MRRLVWKPEKNDRLKRERGITFEEIELSIAKGNLLGILVNKNHPEQIILAVLHNDYLVAVPGTVKKSTILLWTAYQSRKLDRYFKRRKK